ncbi:MAG: agmatine deiminase family protein [Bacteroidales bacterium]|nr:agmatine deiminase family protein [Bacteroidales bacterium]
MKNFDFDVVKTDIIIDGGNVLKSENLVIMTDKVLKENKKKYLPQELIAELERLFEVDKVILIPPDKKDRYGHADGMLRFVDFNTVVANIFYKGWKEFEQSLRDSGLEIKYLEYNVKSKCKHNWAYINFLQTSELILIPKFGVEEDEQAFEQIAQLFPNYYGRIAQVEMNEIIKGGGMLNCMSWTVLE